MSRIDESELALLQTYPHKSKIYLGVEKGVTVLQGVVDGDHASGATTIQLRDVVCDDPAELVKGMTVAQHTVITRDRKVDAMFIAYDDGTQVITIGPNIKTALDGEYVTVFSAFKLWKTDADAWDGSQHIKPFAIMGPPRAGFVGEPLSFVGEYAYSPLGRTIDEYRWKVFDAAVESGDVNAANTVDDPLSLSWDTAGEYLVRLKVTDSAGEFNKAFRPVLMFERTGGNAPYEQVILSDCKFSGDGWSADFKVFGVADSDAFPPQALIVLFAEDYYGNAKQNIGGCFRGAGEIIFAGWIRSDSVVVSAEEQSVAFTADSVNALMDSLNMPSFTFRDGDDTTNWNTFADLDATKIMCHIVQQRTTLDLVADVFMATFATAFDLLDVTEGSLLAQLAQGVLSNCFGYAAGSRFASVTLARRRNILNAAQRAYLPLAAIAFTKSDWLKLTTHGEQFAGVAQVILEGKTGDDTPILKKYPSAGPAHNGSIERISGLVFKDATAADGLAYLIFRSGNRGIKGVTLDLPNYRVLEPAFQEYFAVELHEEDNNRGYNWIQEVYGIVGRELYCVGMSIALNDGYITVQITGEISIYTTAEWEMADPAPTAQHVYGYDQIAV